MPNHGTHTHVAGFSPVRQRLTRDPELVVSTLRSQKHVGILTTCPGRGFHREFLNS